MSACFFLLTLITITVAICSGGLSESSRHVTATHLLFGGWSTT